MKRLIVFLLLMIPSTAYADDAYIKVDAEGNAIGGAIVCDAATCGAGSLYSQLTLQPGERYVLQFKGDPVTGNVAGIPATDPNISLKVDLETNTWTKTIKETVTVITDTATVVSQATKQDTWNPITEETTPQKIITLDSQIIDWAITLETFDWEQWLLDLLAWLENYQAPVYAE